MPPVAIAENPPLAFGAWRKLALIVSGFARLLLAWCGAMIGALLVVALLEHEERQLVAFVTLPALFGVLGGAASVAFARAALSARRVRGSLRRIVRHNLGALAVGAGIGAGLAAWLLKPDIASLLSLEAGAALLVAGGLACFAAFGRRRLETEPPPPGTQRVEGRQLVRWRGGRLPVPAVSLVEYLAPGGGRCRVLDTRPLSVREEMHRAPSGRCEVWLEPGCPERPLRIRPVPGSDHGASLGAR